MEVPFEPRLIDEDELFDYVRRRLSEGWVMVTGDNECIEQLEETVYTPGTSENENFEVVIAPSRRPGGPLFYTFSLAKKTERLKDFLKNADINDEEFNTLLAIEFILPIPGTNKCISRVIGFKESRRDQAIDRIINHLRMLISGGSQ